MAQIHIPKDPPNQTTGIFSYNLQQVAKGKTNPLQAREEPKW